MPYSMIAMMAAGACYLFAAAAFYSEGRPWSGVTTLFYAASCITLYLGSRG